MGLLAGIQSILTIAYSLIVTGVFGNIGRDWLAGYGIGARLELLLVPMVFGIGGAAMVATGTLVGAGRRADAIRTGWMAAAAAGGVTGLIGVLLAIWPGLWSGLFTDDAAIAAATEAYLTYVGPVYAFFGVGLCLYFASQGLETLPIPVAGAVLRLLVVVGGFTALAAAQMLGPQAALIVVTASMAAYGLFVAVGLWLGPWSMRGAAQPAGAGQT